ncbi:TPA: hypothetical protein ACQFK1_002043 [Proteus mirabilis]
MIPPPPEVENNQAQYLKCEEKQWLAESFTIKRGCGDNVLLSQPFL